MVLLALPLLFAYDNYYLVIVFYIHIEHPPANKYLKNREATAHQRPCSFRHWLRLYAVVKS